MNAAAGDQSGVTGGKRYLVVANQTLGGEPLLQRLRYCVAQGPCSLHVLVPATIDQHSWVEDEDTGVALAQERLAQAVDRFSDLGAEVTGEVGDISPVEAINDVLRRTQFDEIILSTLPPGVSRWLRLDLVSRVERSVRIPVTHVIAEPATTAAG